MKSVGELSHVCSQTVLKCWYLEKNGRPEILCSVNKLVRSMTKWTKACDKRLNRLIFLYSSYMWIQNNIVMWVILHRQCRLRMFQDSDSKSTSGGTLCIFGSHTVVLTSWMCKKQTSVSHSSAESEIISFAQWVEISRVACSGIMGSNCFFFFGSVTQTSDRTGRPVDTESSRKSQGKINVLKNTDCVPSNVQSSHQEALLYVFEDNEAVIKMIIKRRSPTMRHVSRTHRVALESLFDRINLDPKIQIKHIDTRKQIADIWTKGNVTRNQWNHLLCLFNISHLSSTVCSDTLAKRSHQYSGEERVTAKSRQMMNLVSRTPSLVSSSIWVSPGKRSYGSQNSMEFYC